MAAVAGYLGHAAADPLSAAPAGAPLTGAEVYALGRLLFERDALDEAIASFREALKRGLPHALRREAYRMLAIACRRRSDLQPAVLHDWVREDGLSTGPYVELAKYYEHRARDLEAAREWTLRAIDLVQRRRMLRGLGLGASRWAAADRELDELLHRLRRIEAKLAARGRRWDKMVVHSGRGE